jgi:transcriptional regulator with XRE-family HTH domain
MRSLRVDPAQIEQVKLAISRSGFPSQRALAEEVGMALATVNKFLNGKPVDRAIFVEICDKLSLDYRAISLIDPASVTEDPQERSLSSSSKSSTLCDWGEAIDISFFYGREKELTNLERAIAEKGCKLLCLLGMGGMGKTALAVKSAKQIQGQFEFVFWRSLRNAPPPEDLLADSIQFLSEQQETNAIESLERKIARLIDYLSQHRCLIVLDNLESVLQGGTYAGRYRKGYEGYGNLLTAVGTAQHQSCLFLTSREKPREVALLEDVSQPVQTPPRRACMSLFLKGLTPERGKAIFTAKAG